MIFVLISVLLATSQRAQAQTREAYVVQSADKTMLTFYYDALRSTRTGTTWGIEEKKKEGGTTYPVWAGTYQVADRLTTRVVFDASFRDFRPTTTAIWFSHCKALKQIEGLEYLNTSEVKDMCGMFLGCAALTSIDLKNFNTQNVTDMTWMFSDCAALTSIDLKNFNTKKVTYMYEMFSGCAALTTIRCNTDWQCQESKDMFAGCTQLKGAVAYDKYKTDATMANPETGYFTRSNEGSVEAYVAQSADKTTLTFYYDALRATRTGTTWGIEETQEEEEGDDTFPAWADSAGIDITRVVFDASFRDFRPTTTARWFYNCFEIKQIEGLESLNTSEVKDMSWMFYRCSGLTSLDVKNFNTQNVTDMSGMFSRCSGLTSLDVSHFNTQNVTDMRGMFSDCSGLTSLDVSQFDTQKVIKMWNMFDGCSALTSLDVSHFNTQNVTDMREMFSGCSVLTTIKCHGAWQCSRSEDMFVGCTQLKGAVAYDKYKTDATMANPETGYFTAKPAMVKNR